MIRRLVGLAAVLTCSACLAAGQGSPTAPNDPVRPERDMGEDTPQVPSDSGAPVARVDVGPTDGPEADAGSESDLGADTGVDQGADLGADAGDAEPSDAGEMPDAGPPPPPVFAFAVDISQIHSGHSLTDSAMFKGAWPGHGPIMIDTLSSGAGNVGKSTIPGSPMQFRRENAPGFGAPDAWNDIANWELLVVTENNLTLPEALFPSGWQRESRIERREELRIWLDNAWTNGNGGSGARLVYYTNWPAHDDYAPSSDWRQRLSDDEVEWLARVDYAEANSTSGAPPIRVIPGLALMMRLYDDAEAGLVPGLRDGSDFMSSRGGWWTDSVHPGDYVNLALAYLHIHVIHRVDPAALPHSGLGFDNEPSVALADYFRTTVRDLVASYPQALK